ncbi:hypothetical protein SAICODRAFT_31300 [Saitoella complicata NRRL Y-17804]|nr:uncharacterized protein SAICODRAFT_31300 [Saitoella complicata NRRL Y-17804]ODQ51334.1 hypothetical protein SAICODRAFT_31300 [Saitoella complicata NRRL Y-17804]
MPRPLPAAGRDLIALRLWFIERPAVPTRIWEKYAIPPTIIRPVSTWHLTLGIMNLEGPGKVEEAVRLLERIRDEIVWIKDEGLKNATFASPLSPIEQDEGYKPLEVLFKGVKTKQTAKPDRARALYTTPVYPTPEDFKHLVTLNAVTAHIRSRLMRAGFLLRANPRYKLHLTLLHTKRRSGPVQPLLRPPNQSTPLPFRKPRWDISNTIPRPQPLVSNRKQEQAQALPDPGQVRSHEVGVTTTNPEKRPSDSTEPNATSNDSPTDPLSIPRRPFPGSFDARPLLQELSSHEFGRARIDRVEILRHEEEPLGDGEGKREGAEWMAMYRSVGGIDI